VYKEERTQNYDPGRTSYMYTPFSLLHCHTVTLLSVNYNKCHKSPSKYEINYDQYNTAHEIKKTQKLNI